jgi:hypothetical protein
MGEGHMQRHEYAAAARAFTDAIEAGGGELARGLLHLAAAGYKEQTGDARRAARQLAHARRRLAPFLPEAEDVDVAGLLAELERSLSD